MGYTVHFIDGSSEYRFEKITINIAKRAFKYTMDKAETSVEDSVYMEVKCNNKSVKISKAAVDEKSKSLVETMGVDSGQIWIKLNPEQIPKPGTYTIKLNVITETSVYKNDSEVTTDNSIPVTVKIKVNL